MQTIRQGSGAPVKLAHGRRSRTTLRPLNAAISSRANTDLTSNVLGTAISYALKSRLKSYSDIQVDVTSTAWDLAGGRFGGMKVLGGHWRTPLMLTAEKIQLEVGELQVDYPALVFQGRVALKNIPTGNCRITLTATDLGNLMVHQLMQLPASKAVQGKPFAFDKGSVRMAMDSQGQAYVSFEGMAAVDGQRYQVVMTPMAGGRLRVAARLVIIDSSMDDDDYDVAASISAQPALALGAGTSIAQAQEHDISHGPGAVAAGLTKFFTDLLINLQGVELSRPTLSMIVPPNAATSKPGQTNPNLLLSIAMNVRLLSLPPLDMKF